MDTSTPTQQNQANSAQPINRTQPPASVPNVPEVVKPTTQSIPTPTSFSTSPEQAPIQGGAVAESADTDDEVVQPAKQEVSTKPVQQTIEAQHVELQPTVPEVAIEKSVEHVVEKSPDTQEPKLSASVKAAGVTLSGPGIPVDENAFGIKSLPMTYEEAVIQDKQTKMNDSKHWLAELVMYVWHKIDPEIDKKLKGVQQN